MNDLIEVDEEGMPMLNAQGFFPAARKSTFALGLDLGQTIDPTALCVVEKIIEPIPPPEGIGGDLKQRTFPPRYEVRWLERLPLQTTYLNVISHVAELLYSKQLRALGVD